MRSEKSKKIKTEQAEQLPKQIENENEKINNKTQSNIENGEIKQMTIDIELNDKDTKKATKKVKKLSTAKTGTKEKEMNSENQSKAGGKKKITFKRAMRNLFMYSGAFFKAEFNDISDKMGDFFYNFGFYAEYEAVAAYRITKNVFSFTGGFFKVIGIKLGSALKKRFLIIKEIFAVPMRRLKRGAKNIRQVVKDERQNGLAHSIKEGVLYFNRGVKNYKHLVTDLAIWLVPIAAIGVFAYTVTTVLNYNYVLAVEYENKLVGYTQNEDTYEDAKDQVVEQIVYVTDEQQRWDIQPSFRLATAEKEVVEDQDKLADSILTASGAEIIEATGLYVDGEFYGATTDSLQLESDLEALKTPYYTDDPNITVAFARDVEQKDGIYLSDSVVDYSSISNLLTTEVQGQRIHTVQAGETPSGIAYAYGITTNDLYALNPGLESDKKFYAGTELMISKAESFLPVKIIERRTVIEETPYSTVRTLSNSLGFGKTQVTQSGVKGTQEVVYDYTFVDGIQTARDEISRTTLSEPINEEVTVGTYVSPGVNVTPGTGGMMWPVPGYRYMSRGFAGQYPAHNGLDICSAYGTPIYASQNGVVTLAKYTGVGYGVYVKINHGGGVETLYAHCSALAVTAGQFVEKGQLIAYMGSTGNSTGNHCHYEVLVNGVRVNPLGGYVAPY